MGGRRNQQRWALSETPERVQSKRHKDNPHFCQCTGWTSQDRPKSSPDPTAPHLRLVGLWTQLKDTGQPLRPEEQSQGQGPRVSVLWWILAEVPLKGIKRRSSTQECPSLIENPDLKI